MISSSPQLELHYSHIKEQYKINSKLHIITGEEFLKYNSLNPFGRKSLQELYSSRMDFLMNYFIDEEKIVRVNISDLQALLTTNISNSINSLKKEIGSDQVDQVLNDLDTAVLSGISSYTRITSTEHLSKKWRKAYLCLKGTTLQLFFFFIFYLRENKISETFTFNGRFACSKALVCASKICGVNYNVYDTNRGPNHYCFRNTSLHSIESNTERALNLYNKDLKIAQKTAIKFYKDKRDRKFTYEKSYTTGQKKGFLGKVTNKKIIAIFTSSDDEYRFIGSDWGDNLKFVDQIKEISQLIDHLGDEYEYFVRMHPNQVSVPQEILNNYKNILGRKSYLILPKSNVDTYHLIDASHIVITFCSSVGPEASFRKKRLITIGPSPYMKLNIGKNVSSFYEAMMVIKNDEFNFDKEGSIIWANYIMNYSDPLPRFESSIEGIYKIDGKKISYKNKLTLGLLLSKFEIFLSINRLFDIRSMKIALAKILTLIDGRVRGDHLIK
ncbi:MAG: hypothetical protein JJ846_007900 [Prochlorococcus marinus CUG1437]|nr:hypothetical protein [Prochlorococcus marinus CUG1437]